MSKPELEVGPSQLDSAFKNKWAVYTHGQLKQRCAELGVGGWLIDGLLPERSVNVAVGASGLGKSPLFYQAAICVASGKDFLGRKVKQGTVLYLDFENGLGDVDELCTSLARHLGLEKVPDGLRLWNYNDAPPNWSASSLSAMVEDLKPSLLVIDPLGACWPNVEKGNSEAQVILQELRSIARKYGCVIVVVQHIRKSPSDSTFAPAPLETADLREWFNLCRGPSVIINGTDVRIGVGAKDGHGGPAGADEIALVMRGRGRIRGEIATTYLVRDRDEEGHELGYRRLAGMALLHSPAQKETFQKLPDQFLFKQAQQTYGKGAQATTDFLKKCQSVGILRKATNGYEKVKIPE